MGLWTYKHIIYNIWLRGHPENQDDQTTWYEKTINKNIVPIQIYGQ